MKHKGVVVGIVSLLLLGLVWQSWRQSDMPPKSQPLSVTLSATSAKLGEQVTLEWAQLTSVPDTAQVVVVATGPVTGILRQTSYPSDRKLDLSLDTVQSDDTGKAMLVGQYTLEISITDKAYCFQAECGDAQLATSDPLILAQTTAQLSITN
jgi:hypothetical protein